MNIDIIKCALVAVFSSVALCAAFNPDVNGGIDVVVDGESVNLGSGVIYVGSSSSNNSLTLENGASVSSSERICFSYAGYDNNHILITGGSTLTADGFVNSGSAKRGGNGSVTVSGEGSVLHLTNGSYPASTTPQTHQMDIFIADGGLALEAGQYY